MNQPLPRERNEESENSTSAARRPPPPFGGVRRRFFPNQPPTRNAQIAFLAATTSLAQGASPSLRFLRFSRFLRTFFLESAFSRPESRSPNPQNPQKTQNPQVSVLSS